MASADALPTIVGTVSGLSAAATTIYAVRGAIRRTEITTDGRTTTARNLLSRWRDWYQSTSPDPTPPKSLLDDTDRELNRDVEETT